MESGRVEGAVLEDLGLRVDFKLCWIFLLNAKSTALFVVSLESHVWVTGHKATGVFSM